MNIRFYRTDNEAIRESNFDQVLADYNPTYGRIEDWHFYDTSATIQLNSLEELAELVVKGKQEIIIAPYSTTNEQIDIEIYDAYRE